MIFIKADRTKEKPPPTDLKSQNGSANPFAKENREQGQGGRKGGVMNEIPGAVSMSTHLENQGCDEGRIHSSMSGARIKEEQFL